MALPQHEMTEIWTSMCQLLIATVMALQPLAMGSACYVQAKL